MLKSRSVLFWILATVFVAACSNDDGGLEPRASGECPSPTALSIEVPEGVPAMPVPPDNPTTVEGVRLGRLLFYDPILSGDSTQACGTCHAQTYGFSDFRPFSEGIDGIKGTRNTQAIVNAAWTPETFWDGRARGLEEQALGPVPNPIEMHLEWPEAVRRLERHADYPDLFCAAFGDRTVTVDRVVKAIAQFERTMVSFNSKYDRVRRGEETFTDLEAGGYRIFKSEVGACNACHPEPLFTTGGFHNTGLDPVPVDRGRYDVTGDPADMGRFKVPSLRNIFDTLPYMHDGRFSDLNAVIGHYNQGFHDGDGVDPLIRERLLRRSLTSSEVDSLIGFLETLTDGEFLTNPELANPYRQ
jgi:cytochrome c peroxidase